MVKYYMNNPCVVIREVTTEFSEVKINPKYTANLSGDQWCDMCLVGHQGTPRSHTCDEYQEVIDAINDEESAIIVMVENRLLHDEPVEIASYKRIIQEMNTSKEKVREMLDEISSAKAEVRSISLEADRLNKEIESLKDKEKKANKELTAVLNDLDKAIARRDLYNRNKPNKAPQEKKIRQLLESDIRLEYLLAAGVDNWDHYGSSLPTQDQVNSYIDSVIFKYKQ